MQIAEPQNLELKTYLKNLFDLTEDDAREIALDLEQVMRGDTESTRYFETKKPQHTVRISDELAQRIANHVADLLDRELPTSIEIPATDRGVILDRVSQSCRAHLETHWAKDASATFCDAPDDHDIPSRTA
jgi:hypothetical protein